MAAITPLSITQSMKPAANPMGMSGVYPTIYGVLNGNSTSYLSGCPLIANAGTLDEAAITTLAGETVIGILSQMAPRRQDMTPLTTGVLPATALPGQRTTPSAGSGSFVNNNDPDFGADYHPWIPGCLFTAHLTTGTVNGTDYRAGTTTPDVYDQGGYGRTKTSAPASDEIEYATKTGLWTLNTATLSTTNDAEFRIVWNVIPQPTSLNGTAFLAQPGPLNVGGAGVGTFNPLVVFMPTKSIWFGQ